MQCKILSFALDQTLVNDSGLKKQNFAGPHKPEGEERSGNYYLIIFIFNYPPDLEPLALLRHYQLLRALLR